jgi:hypothetical protein
MRVHVAVIWRVNMSKDAKRTTPARVRAARLRLDQLSVV